MLSISHALTGAFIAYNLPQPILYTPLVLASHYLEDWIPHWDVGTGLSNGKRHPRTAFLLEIIDILLAGILVLAVFIWPTGEFWPFTNFIPQNSSTWHVIIGAFIGLLPDFIEAPRNFLKKEPRFIAPLNKFHGRWHHSTPNKIIGLLPQIILWISLIAITIYNRTVS